MTTVRELEVEVENLRRELDAMKNGDDPEEAAPPKPPEWRPATFFSFSYAYRDGQPECLMSVSKVCHIDSVELRPSFSYAAPRKVALEGVARGYMGPAYKGKFKLHRIEPGVVKRFAAAQMLAKIGSWLERDDALNDLLVAPASLGREEIAAALGVGLSLFVGGADNVSPGFGLKEAKPIWNDRHKGRGDQIS